MKRIISPINSPIRAATIYGAIINMQNIIMADIQKSNLFRKVGDDS